MLRTISRSSLPSHTTIAKTITPKTSLIVRKMSNTLIMSLMKVGAWKMTMTTLRFKVTLRSGRLMARNVPSSSP